MRGAEPGCDPAVRACREALPSALPLELRRLVPQLPAAAPPRGQVWEDTLAFDDGARQRGLCGSVVTSYRVKGDTVIGGSRFWVVAWRAVRRTYATVPGFAGLVPGVPVEERGMALVEEGRRVPVFAMWLGGGRRAARAASGGRDGQGLSRAGVSGGLPRGAAPLSGMKERS